MKKMTKSMLLSLLMATTFATTVAAAAISIDNAKATESNAVVETADFRMVDGASIRMASPLGLRFIAEMTDDVYEDLITAESGVDKKMGMFIAPYSYFDGYVGKYQDVATKLDLVFYDSTGAVENKIYSDTENGETVYRANGVITDLYLKNYSRDFVGIAYIAETTGGKTTYTYADFNAEDNVRNAAYVAIEAYEDYTDAAPRAVFSQYVWGAHLYDNGMTESNGTYTYNGKEYASIEDAAKGLSWSLSMDKYAYVKAGESANVNATVTGDGKTVDFSGMHINFSSSDESILTINDNGVMTAKGNGIVTVTASFMGKTATCQVIAGAIDFEDGKTPSWFTGARVASFTTTDMYGGKVMEVKSTSDAYGDICVIMPRDTIGAFFANSDVDYFAFDLKLPEGATTARGDVYFRAGNGGWAVYESGTYDVPPTDAFKTYYIARATYEQWIANGVTDTRILNVAKGVMNGMSLYIDNVRGVSAEERIEEWYSFESGGVRTNNGNQPLLYMSGGNQWELGFSNINSATAGFTSEIVSDGNRAFQFTKYSGDTKISLNHNTDTDREKELRAAGYFSFDVYVPAGANATIKWGNYSGGTLKTGWNTVYVQVDATNNDLILLSDTTGSTYVIDNIQMLTEEEYFENAYGFESGGATLRTSGSEADNYAGTFYVYMGADRRKNVYSIAATGSVSNPRISSENVYDGDYSLAFDKNGDLNLQFRADSATYAALRNGFSFWIYSTIGVNGTAATNLRNGNGQKLNGGAGMNISKNTWTKITLTKDDIVQGTGEAGCKFLSIVGSTNGTYYIDDIQPLEYYTVTLNSGIGYVSNNTMEVCYGDSYTLPTPAANVKFLGWVDQDGNSFPTEGIWKLKEDVVLTATYAEAGERYYNSSAEWEENGGVVGLTLGASTYTSSGGDGALPQPNKDTNSEDMSYYRFAGDYGLNDFLVFDFTGNNMPILSFFNNSVTNTIYNHAQDADVKGWLVTNGIYVKTGLPYGGFAGAHANRVTLIGPYNISYTYDDNGSNQPITQVRTSIGSVSAPSPITMNSLNANDQYRVIVGWVESGNNMNLRMIAWNMTEGVKIVDYNQGGVPKADWTGDIVLYGHYSRETYVDNVYSIVHGLDEALALYTPSMLAYKAEWDGNGVTLAASTHVGADANVPLNSGYKEDMSYVAFNGSYGLNDYVVFDFTGDNFPFVSFFNNTITNTIWNWALDENVHGWVISNGLRAKNGSPSGGITSANSSRIQYAGSYKYMFKYDDNGTTKQWRAADGSASAPSPISIRTLETVTDPYRAIIGFEDNAGNGIKARIYVINMTTGATVLNSVKAFAASSYPYLGEGSIILYGQFGKTTVLDSVFGIEEDTTIDALISKYGKDVDYSDESAVTLERYGYSSITDGQWTVDGNNQVSNPTDYRELQATYDTYAASGLNIMLAQNAFSTDKSGWADTSRYLDMAANAGLKVILTDWHIQNASAPLKAGSKGPELSSESDGYGPWVLASDLNDDGTGKTAAVQEYLDLVKAAGLTMNTTRFKDQNALDAYLMGEIKHYKDHPAFYGVMLADEPSYHNAYCYGKVYQSLKRIAPEMYVQYNLLPLEQTLSTIKYRYPGLSNKSSASNTELENAYKAYVTGFIDAMGTDYIQYDDYPFKSAEEGILFWTDTVPYVDNTALRNIQLIAEIAAERGLDVKVVTQTALMHTGGKDGPVHIRKITEADARWLNNYLMGFGVKQINYFTYWTKASNSSTGEWYDDGGSFVNRDGTMTEVYNIMKAIMAENTAFAPTISNFNYSDSHVYGTNNDSNLNNDHISWSSSLTDSNYSFKWLAGVTTNKEYTLVTELYDEENYNYMYMLMNTIDTYYGGTQSVTVTLDSKVASFYVYSPNGSRTLVTGNTYTVSLTAGQAIYIMPAQING